MAEPSIHDIISKNFSTVTTQEWQRAARTEMPENISLENLLWTVDGLAFSPYYTKADVKETEYLRSFQNTSNRLLSSCWLNMPQVSMIPVDESHRKANAFLQMGADGIVFDITKARNPDVNKLLKSINWEDCFISFKTSDTKVVTDIFARAEEIYDPFKLKGSIWWNQMPKSEQIFDTVAQHLKKYRNYHLLGIQISPSTPVKEIASALAQGVRLVDELTNLNADCADIFHSISLCFASDENILVNIAKLKSVRMLWYQLSQSFQVSDYSPTDLQIRCTTGPQVNEKFLPHGNMIRNTCQAMSAIVGGANEITVIDSEEEADSMTDRVALNVANILKEESHFNKVSDPLAGSYAIEKMVHEFSKAAWADFVKQQS